MDRLTLEENIGLSIDKGNDCPSCYVCWACDKKVRKCPYFKDAIKKLKQYEDMEEQGKLVILPCKPGDTVHVPYRGKVQEMTVVSVSMNRFESITFRWEVKHEEDIYPNLIGFSSAHIGKTVFLTEHEAKEALAEMEGKGL